LKIVYNLTHMRTSVLHRPIIFHCVRYILLISFIKTVPVAYPEFFFRGGGGGVKQIQLRTEGRGNGDLGAVAPSSEFPLNLQMSETVFLLGCYGFIFHGSRNLAQLRNFGGGGGLNPPNPPRYATELFVVAFVHCSTIRCRIPHCI
jgi:hypothetical protein